MLLFLSELLQHPRAGLFGTTTDQRGYLDSTVFLTHSLRGPQTQKRPQELRIQDMPTITTFSMMLLVEIKQGTWLLLPNQRLSEAKIVPYGPVDGCGSFLTQLYFVLATFLAPLHPPPCLFLVLFNIFTSNFVNLVTLQIETTKHCHLRSKPQFPLFLKYH